MSHTAGVEGQRRQIGQFITELREGRGLSQKDLAKALGTSQSAVARMERGGQNFTAATLAKLSRAFRRPIVTVASGKGLNFRVEGGRRLSGTIETRTSKNSAVALLCASLLNRGRTTFRNMPHIEEVERILEVLRSIGVKAAWRGNDIEVIPPKQFAFAKLDTGAAVKTRSVLMLLGPFIHLAGRFSLPHPGGCKIGRRSVRPHLFALENFGVTIDTKKTTYEVEVGKRTPAEAVLYEMGDTVTENALMAAARMPGTSVIKFASANYMGQDVCYYLKRLGVEVEGIGTSTLTVHGNPDINVDVDYYPSEDPIEAMLFLSIAATTGSSLTILRCPIDFLEIELLKLAKMGFKYKILRRYKARNDATNLVDICTYPSRLSALEEKIHPQPYPGLNIDNLPFFVPIATQAKGTTLIHDWVYENRAIYYMELTKLGAELILADPYRVYIEGPTELKAADVVCPPALRPAVIILIAMLAAKGTSMLRNVYSINRGYEDLANRLTKLGAKIQIVS